MPLVMRSSPGLYAFGSILPLRRYFFSIPAVARTFPRFTGLLFIVPFLLFLSLFLYYFNLQNHHLGPSSRPLPLSLHPLGPLFSGGSIIETGPLLYLFSTLVQIPYSPSSFPSAPCTVQITITDAIYLHSILTSLSSSSPLPFSPPTSPIPETP